MKTTPGDLFSFYRINRTTGEREREGGFGVGGWGLGEGGGGAYGEKTNPETQTHTRTKVLVSCISVIEDVHLRPLVLAYANIVRHKSTETGSDAVRVSLVLVR